MSRTMRRNAEPEKEERRNEKANGGNDPTLAFFFLTQRVNFKCAAVLFDVKPRSYGDSLCLQTLKECRVYTIKKKPKFSKYGVFIKRWFVPPKSGSMAGSRECF